MWESARADDHALRLLRLVGNTIRMGLHRTVRRTANANRLRPPLTAQIVRNLHCHERLEVQRTGHELIVALLYSCTSSMKLQRHQPAPDSWSTRLHRPLLNRLVLVDAPKMLLHRPWRAPSKLAAPSLSAGLSVFGHTGLIALTPKALANAWRLRQDRIDRIHAKTPPECSGS